VDAGATARSTWIASAGIQLLTSAGLRLDEVGAALDRQAGRPLVETYSEQVRLLEIALPRRFRDIGECAQ
jgi:hypothetical protein